MNPVASTVTIVGCSQAGIVACSENKLNDGLVASLGTKRNFTHDAAYHDCRCFAFLASQFLRVLPVPGGNVGLVVMGSRSVRLLASARACCFEWIDYANPAREERGTAATHGDRI
jgi:hypothetical protein